MEELHNSGLPPPEPNRLPSPAHAGEAENRAELIGEIQRLKQHLKEVESRQLPEAERFRRELAELTAERDAAAGELRELKRHNAVAGLANAHHFNDPEYLDYLLDRHGIDPGDERATADFLRELRRAQPRFFNVELKSGAGSRPDVGSNHGLTAAGGTDGIAALLADAPEII